MGKLCDAVVDLTCALQECKWNDYKPTIYTLFARLAHSLLYTDIAISFWTMAIDSLPSTPFVKAVTEIMEDSQKPPKDASEAHPSPDDQEDDCSPHLDSPSDLNLISPKVRAPHLLLEAQIELSSAPSRILCYEFQLYPL